jgi:hypothetical protein
MSFESPLSVLYNSDGIEVTVTASQAIAAIQPGIAVMGSGSAGWQPFKVAPTGELFVTGALSVSVATVATQSVQVASWLSSVTASMMELGAANTTVSGVAASTTSYQILSTNTNRRAFYIYKEATGTCYVKFGATGAATNSFTLKMGPSSFFENEKYTGPVCVIFSADTAGGIMVTEETY